MMIIQLFCYKNPDSLNRVNIILVGYALALCRSDKINIINATTGKIKFPTAPGAVPTVSIGFASPTINRPIHSKNINTHMSGIND